MTHPASYTTGTVSFPGVKRLGRVFEHQLISLTEVKERVEVYLLALVGVLSSDLDLYLELTA